MCPLKTTPGRCSLLLALLLAAFACNPAAGDWLPFRPTDPLGGCHEVALTAVRRSYSISAADEGQAACGTQLGWGWQYSGTQENYPPDMTSGLDRDSGYTYWTHRCRRCGLAAGTILMWFGTAPACYGSCPADWWQITGGVDPEDRWGTKHIDDVGNDLMTYVDVRIVDTSLKNSADFGEKCTSGGGKVLCALGGRPASAGCSYTWRGTAPDCRDACEPGETLVAKDWYGGGAECLSGTHNKMLCERCQTEILNLNDCTAPQWFGTAPACAGECNTGDRVMARAQRKSDVPADQDPGGFGKKCLNGWKVRCHRCSVNWGALSTKPPRGKVTPHGRTCTKPKVGRIWAGRAGKVLRGVKTYADCCRECHDEPSCRRFHVGPGGCFIFRTTRGTLTSAHGWHERGSSSWLTYGRGAWRAGRKRA